jgi:hypothetical protein
MTESPPKHQIIDNPDVREIYVNKTLGGSFDGTAITLTLGCTRFDRPAPQGQLPSIYVTGRLTLSPTAAVELLNSLNSILAAISKTPNNKLNPSQHDAIEGPAHNGA